MATFFAKRHLRLVGASSSVDEDAHRSNKATPENHISSEDGKILTVFFVSEEDLTKNGSFAKFLGEKQPEFLFDVRAAPRLDFVAPNRALAFRKFADWGIDYVDIMGVLDCDSVDRQSAMPENWVGFVAEKICAAEKQNGYFAFIFDDDIALRRSRYVLPSELNKAADISKVNVDIFDGSNAELIAL